ncbi:hypothetical protein [Pleomorphomonas sp. NRK KF1]|uniref:hypothetical protein n=1 Tax=Pleomorphomonas sp. NRK KF1 TaxID=2943000 RepID=UPI00353091BA
MATRRLAVTSRSHGHEAAVEEEFFAADEAAVVGGQEQHRPGGFLAVGRGWVRGG